MRLTEYRLTVFGWILVTLIVADVALVIIALSLWLR